LKFFPSFSKPKIAFFGLNSQQKIYQKILETLAQKSMKKSRKISFAVLA